MISVIIPIYNAAVYLSTCLDSLLLQDETNWEAVLVNDGSTDESGIICEQYRKKDSRFRYFSKPNGGVSSARNLGLQSAKGEWIIFLDADDSLPPNALRTLMQSSKNDIDFVIGGYELFDQDGTIIYRIEERVSELLDRDSAILMMYKPKYYNYLGFICGKLYKTEIILNNSLAFNPEIIFNEDRLFTTQYLAFCNRILFITEPIYNYLQHPNSATATREKGFNEDYVTDMDAMILMRDIVSLHSPINLQVATEGIASSYWQIQYFMNKFHATSLKRVLSLHKKLWKNLSFKDYFHLIIVPFFKKVFKKIAPFSTSKEQSA